MAIVAPEAADQAPAVVAPGRAVVASSARAPAVTVVPPV